LDIYRAHITMRVLVFVRLDHSTEGRRRIGILSRNRSHECEVCAPRLASS